MKINICPTCVVVSSLWLALSAGVAWDYLALSIYLVPIALLMGGTVVGIAYLGEKKCHWAAQNQSLWKALVIAGGMILAYVLLMNLSKFVVIVEFVILLVIAYFLFSKGLSFADSGSKRITEIEEKMEHCC
jgi:hypothetical protein